MRNKDMRNKSTAAVAEAEEKLRVMVAIDDSDESLYALEWVLDNLFGRMAPFNYDDQTHHALTIIHVKEPFPYYVFPGVHAVFATTSVIRVQEENASAILNQAVHMCTQRNVEAKTLMLQGDPKEMICDLAQQTHVDLIVVGSRGLGKIKRAFLGSVSDYVTHHAKCPVLIVKPPTSGSLK